jgi:hypothetical protein
LSWNVPASDGGSSITSYDIYRGTAAGGESATPIATNVSGTSFTDTGLTNGTTYYYTVAAMNVPGVSPQSAEVSATPHAVVPSLPTGLVASGDIGQVTLSWSVPASDGGSSISGYDIYRGTAAGGESATPIATTDASGTSFTDTGLTNGSTYYYTVAAVNAVGVSQQSAEASATPSSTAVPPLTEVPAIPGTSISPSNPSALFPTVSPGAGNGSVGLPPARSHSPVHAADVSSIVPIDTRLLGAQIVGLAVLVGAVTIAIARLSLRRRLPALVDGPVTPAGAGTPSASAPTTPSPTVTPEMP